MLTLWDLNGAISILVTLKQLEHRKPVLKSKSYNLLYRTEMRPLPLSIEKDYNIEYLGFKGWKLSKGDLMVIINSIGDLE